MKKCLSVLLIVIVLLFLSSCKQKTKSDILEPNDIDSNKEIVITFYHPYGASNFPITIQKIFDKFAEEMKETYGVKVRLNQISCGDYKSIKKIIMSELDENKHPTISITLPEHLSTYLHKNVNSIRDLSDYIVHSEYGLEGSKEDSYGYFESFYDEGRSYDITKKMYSIPFIKTGQLLVYNKTIFEKYNWKVPTTWNEVIDICERFKETDEYKEKVANSIKCVGLSIDFEYDFYLNLLHQYGGEFSGFNSIGKGEFLFNSSQSISAINWLINAHDNGNIGFAQEYDNKHYCSDVFKAGNCVMCIESLSGLSYAYPIDNSFEMGITTYPQTSDKEEDKFVLLDGTNLSLFKCEDKQEELFGWLFIKYLTNDESSLTITRNAVYYPMRKDALLRFYLYDNNSNYIREGFKKFTEQINYLHNYSYIYGIDYAKQEITSMLKKILYNQEPNKKIEDLLSDTLNNINSYVNK